MTNNIEATRDQETALLGSVMRDGSIYAQARELVSPEQFYIIPHRWLWEAYEALHLNGMNIDTITAGDELERAGHMKEFVRGQMVGRAFLSVIREYGDPRNWQSYAENVHDYAAKRQIMSFLNQGAQWAVNGRRARDIIQDMMTEFSKVAIYGAADEYTVPVSTAVSDAYQWTDKAVRGEIVGIPTGLMDLDKILGALFAQNVYLIAGRPGDGKTALALQIALHAAKKYGKRAAVFSLEMSRAQVGMRLISQDAEINLKGLITGQLQSDEWGRYAQAIEEVSKFPIVINDLSSININQIRQTARKIKATGGLDLIVVDYIQLADAGDKKREGTREQEVSAVSRGLKHLARELDVPILAAAQLSRKGDVRQDKRPILSDLRESGSLEQDAYAVIFLYRPDLYEKTKTNTTQAIVAKHRNGETGTVDLVFRSQYVKFADAVTKYVGFQGEDK